MGHAIPWHSMCLLPSACSLPCPMMGYQGDRQQLREHGVSFIVLVAPSMHTGSRNCYNRLELRVSTRAYLNGGCRCSCMNRRQVNAAAMHRHFGWSSSSNPLGCYGSQVCPAITTWKPAPAVVLFVEPVYYSRTYVQPLPIPTCLHVCARPDCTHAPYEHTQT